MFQSPPAKSLWSWLPIRVKTALPSQDISVHTGQVWSRYLCSSGGEGQDDYLWPGGKLQLQLLKYPKHVDFSQVDKISISQFQKQIQYVTFAQREGGKVSL